MNYVLSDTALSWGRVIRQPQNVAAPRFREDLPELIANHPGKKLLAVGLRRSYGDSVFNSLGGIVDMTSINRYISLDSSRGIVRAEAGLSLDALLQKVVPLSFFVPVTPGTRYVTLGGAVANDVHGKNHHHSGTFGCHVLRLGLQRSDSQILEISPQEHGELFAATIGGLGLTGIITWVELQLQRIDSSQLDIEIIPYQDLDEFWDLAEKSCRSHEHTVAWIDCTAIGKNTGRGIFIRGNWGDPGDLEPHTPGHKLSMPLEAPSSLLNRFNVNLFNKFYYYVQQSKAGRHKQSYASFFYPLDSINQWNRLYGRKGFWQYQCALPPETMKDGINSLLTEISRSGQGSFLSVLKTFGKVPSPGLLSFPMEGATLALDFPNRGEKTRQLLSRLDEIVAQANGRIYAAKDGRTSKTIWQKSYTTLEHFLPHIDPVFCSDFWRRVQP